MLFKTLGKAFLLCLIFAHISYAGVPKDISFFDDKPRSIAKDFYIYRYLNSEHCSSSDAWKLLEQTSRMTYKLFHTFASKLEDKGFSKVSACLKMKTKELLESDDKDCIAIGLSVYEAKELDKELLAKLAKKLEPYKEAIPLRVLSQPDIYKAMLEGENEEFFQVFNKIGKRYRQEHFDKKLSVEKMQSLEKGWGINPMIKLIVTDNKLKNIQKSLLHVSPDAKVLSHNSLFFLGLNALKLHKKEQALKYFDVAYEKAYYQMDKDKVLFWKFLATKDIQYKEEIQQSIDLNIYTILMGKKDNKIMIAKAYEPHPFYDETDPFAWNKLLENMKDKTPEELTELAKVYLYGSTLPHFSFIMEKASNYKEHYFPTPYPKYLKDVSPQRKALILALARQESRFVPAAISTSYALGMMQFMPFLAQAIAEQQGFVDFDLDDMFNPETAYMFANIHLDYLEKHLFHPLFIAYAYNGGIGFTKRLLQSGIFTKGAYEPYMSMELIHYDESRKYGKKVLANYITYMRIFKQKVSLKNLFEDLLKPEKTDNFR